MKTPLLLFACVATFAGFGRLAGADGPDAPLPPDQIETLVAPIALYPDPLVALVLPAATHPSDVVLAARFLANGGSADHVLSEPWDESVKALARYREVVDYMDRNLDWTRRLGDCFLEQPDDVMDAIQEVRARARAAGMLADSPQQEVIIESDEICIVPTNPTVLYVPRYDPVVLCRPLVTSIYPRTWITFGVAYRVGPWLRYDCDWRARHVRIAHRPPSWYYQPDWRRHHHHSSDISWTRWTPPPRHERRFDRHDRQPDRHWIGANETITHNDRTIHPRDRRGDRDRSPSPGFDRDRERHTRPDFDHRRRRETAPPIATAPSVVATYPSVPTAPAVVSQSPGSFATPTPPPPPFSGRRHFPRRDDDGGPHVDRRSSRPDVRPGTTPAPVMPPPPMTTSPVGPPVMPPPPIVRHGGHDSTNRAAPPAREERRGGERERERGDRGRHERQLQN